MGGLALAGLLALVGFLPMTAAETIPVSGTVTFRGNTAVNNSHTFTDNAGVLNFYTVKTDNTDAANITYNGTITSATGISGTINVYGNKGMGNTGAAALFSTDLSGFTGTVTIGNATSSQLARDWVVFNTNAKGSENAHWVFNTGTNSGILLNVGPVKFGSLSGSGITRGNTGVTVGAATTASDVDVFDGLFTQNNNAGVNYTIEKTGAGTWIWTGNVIPDLTAVSTAGTVYASNQIGTLKITGGTLQIGDYGHKYTEGNLYYKAGDTGDGVLGKGVAGTGSVDVSAVLSTKYHQTRQKEDKTWEAYEVDSNPIQVTNATLAFGLAADTEITNAITSTSGTVSNVNPNTTITLSGLLAGSGLTFKDGKFLVTGTTNTVTGYTIGAGATLKFPAGTSNTRTYSFAASDAVLDITTSTGTGADDVADSTLTGAISSTAAGYGKIYVHGNKGKNTKSKGLYVNDNLTGFKGTIQIGDGTRDATYSRDWLVMNDPATGSQYATFDIRTGADSGILVNSSKTVNLGSVIGSGVIRTDSGTRTLSVGALLTESTDTAVFHGFFTNYNDGKFNVNKVGAGTWIWSGKLTGTGKSNFNSVNVQEGTLQIGDLNYTYGAGDMYYAENATGDGSGTIGNLLTSTAPVTIAADATLAFALNNDITVSNAITFTAGTTTTADGAISNLNSAKTVTLSGVLTGPNAKFTTGKFKITGTTNTVTNFTTGEDAEVTIDPYISGQFTFNGSGKVILTNGFATTAGTTTTINGGTVAIGNNTYLRGFQITVNNGGMLELSKDRTGGIAAPIEFNVGSTLRSLKETALEFQGNISGTGVTIAGGIIKFTSNQNTLEAWDIDAGTVIFGNQVPLTSATSFDLASGSTIQFNKAHTTWGNNAISATLTSNGATICTNADTTFTGKATGSLIKTGSKTLSLNNSGNALTKVTIKEGTLTLQQTSNLNVVLDGGTLNNASWNTVNAEVTANGGAIYYNSTYLLASLKNATGVENANITLSRSVAQGQISQGTNMGGNLDSINSGFAKDFTGTVNVTGYAIVSFGLEKDANDQIVNSDYTKMTLNLNTSDDAYSGVYLARPNLKAQFGAITGDGLVMTGVDNRTGVFTLQVGAKIGEGETATFNGAFADKAVTQAGNSTLNIEKVGAGTWVFGESKKTTSSVDNYISTLTVSAGEMVLARNSGLSSATNVTVAKDATLSIANAGQEIASTLTLNANSTLNFELSSDPLKSGSLTVETLAMDPTSTVELSYDEAFLESIAPGLTLNVMNLTNENATWTTKFVEAFNNSGLNNYFSIVQNGNSYSISIDGNKVPEPSAWLLLLLGLPFLCRFGRR